MTRQKRKQEIRQLPERLVFNRSDTKLFRNTKTAYIAYHRLHMKKPCSSPLLPYHLPPSRAPVSTSEVICTTSQITEGQQQPWISFGTWMCESGIEQGPPPTSYHPYTIYVDHHMKTNYQQHQKYLPGSEYGKGQRLAIASNL